MTPCPSTGCAPTKKRLPPTLCGRPVSAPRGSPRTDPLTIYQSVGCEPDPNCRVFSYGLHSRWVSVLHVGFHSGGKLLGRAPSWSFLNTGVAQMIPQQQTISVSAAHSAPAGQSTGLPRAKHVPALLAHCNAAARAFRSRSLALVAGAIPTRPSDAAATTRA